MADQQQWQAIYAFSARDGIDLSKSAIGDTGTDGTSCTNTGHVRGEGSQHFVLTSTVVWGMLGSDGTKYFALPLTNRPAWESGQEMIEADKAIGEVAPTAGTGYNYLRGITGPRGTIEFQASMRTLPLFLWGLCQRGVTETPSTNDSTLTFNLPAATAPTPEIFISALRRFSTDSADSQVLWDSVVTRFAFSSSEGEALNVSVDLLGRFLDNDFKALSVSGEAGSGGDVDHNAPDLGFIEENPLLHQNMDCVIETVDDTTWEVVEIESFDFTVTAEFIPKRYNNKFPIRFAIGGYTIEGSVRIPWGAPATGGNTFHEFLADTANPSNVDVTPISIDFFWKGTRLALGTTYNSTTINSVARVLAVGDVRIGVGAVITDVQVEGEDESMLNISFTGVNIRSGNTVTQQAFGVYIRGDFGDDATGYGIP